MKSAGLSSTYRNMLKRSVKITALATRHEHQLAAKEKKKTLRMEAARAQFERQKREVQNSPKKEAVEPELAPELKAVAPATGSELTQPLHRSPDGSDCSPG